MVLNEGYTDDEATLSGNPARPEDKVESGQRGKESEWLKHFPLTSALKCKELQYPTWRIVKSPLITCALNAQERFARSVSEVLRNHAALSSVLDASGLWDEEAVAKSLMSQKELEMYERWCGGHQLSAENWSSLS